MPKIAQRCSTDYADLLILDDMIPCGFSPFRTIEYEHYLSFFNARLLSMEGWHLWNANEDFATHLRQLPIDAELKERIVPFSAESETTGRLAYLTFLGNATKLLPYLESRQLPFIFQLYPGGGFKVEQSDSDAALRRVLLSSLCRKVIVTQRLTRDYIIDRIGCDPAKVELIFGGVFESRIGFDFHQDKRLFERDKDTLDLCFVAHKYGSDLTSKGYDQFVDIARALSRDDPRLRFHVVGDYAGCDIELGDAEKCFTFYGRRKTEFFQGFYPAMDMIVSVNRPFALASGAFDGFPTGGCIEAGFYGVLNCINDPLDLNPVFTSGQDIVLLDFDTPRSVTLLRRILDDPVKLYELAYRNWRKFHDIFGTDKQLFARSRLIAAELSRYDGLALPPAPGKSMLDVECASPNLELENRVVALEHERQRLENVYLVLADELRRHEQAYQALEGHALVQATELRRQEAAYRTLEGHALVQATELRRQEEAYRTLERHYLAMEQESIRLANYIRSREAAH